MRPLSFARATNGRSIVPHGFAHGFQTLEDETEVLYLMTDTYDGGLSRGVRWDDPAFGIAWPLPLTAISEKDAAYPDINGTEAFSFV